MLPPIPSPDWHDLARCRDSGVSWFPDPTSRRPDLAAEVSKLVAWCEDCPVSAACLRHAIEHPEPAGVWGGVFVDVARDHIDAAGSALRSGLAVAFSLAVGRARQATARVAAGLPPTEPRSPGPWRPERPCPRCGAVVKAGRHPTDRNTATARCGKVKTYNNGCRCGPCVEAKAAASARSRG